MKRILLTGATVVTGEKVCKGTVAIEGDRIANVWFEEEEGEKKDPETEFPDAEVVNLDGLTLFPGGVDAHVHFRDPGLTHKADFTTESRAALLGGITSIIDMPNTKPATTSKEALQEKLRSTEGRSYVNYGFHIGATNDNLEEIRKLIATAPESFCGVKVFMGSSTGNMLVDNGSSLEGFFKIKEKPVLVHCEDESTIKKNLEAAREKYGDSVPFSLHPQIRSRMACIKSTIKALEMAMKNSTHLHVCHISTKEEAEMVRAAKIHNKGISGESSANYMWFCSDDYEKMGAKIKCNPAIKDAEDRQFLRGSFAEGYIDTLGSDHAPHLLAEKDAPYVSCPSGIPSIQHQLSAMITIAREEDFPLSRIASAIAGKPAEIFGLENRGKIAKGYYADIVAVDTQAKADIQDAYKCNWSPYDGDQLYGKVCKVWLSGRLAVDEGRLTCETPEGKALIFRRSL